MRWLENGEWHSPFDGSDNQARRVISTNSHFRGIPALTTVLFDLDSTLCRHREDINETLERAFDRVGVDRFRDKADLGAVLGSLEPADSEVEFYELSLRAAGKHVGAPDDALARVPEVARADTDVIDHSNVAFLPGAETALASASDRFRVGLVTNGGEANQRRKMAALGIEDAFDAYVYANQPEVPIKPDPTPFETALSALGASPAEALHVGGSLPTDIAGANALGIRSAWLADETGVVSDPEPDHVLDSLHDLPAVLDAAVRA